jgi:hypothetical protein
MGAAVSLFKRPVEGEFLIMNRVTTWLGRRLSLYLSQPLAFHEPVVPMDPARYAACLRPADVLLVEGNTRLSVAIKYLTQSTWSHAALYVGPSAGLHDAAGRPLVFIEADVAAGVRALGPDAYAGLHCRLCRPVGLSAAEQRQVVAYACGRLGHQYDLKNVIDLARYLLPNPPVPVGWRRRLLALGSGDPTRAICSTLIAQCFAEVRYPILPQVETLPAIRSDYPGDVQRVHHVRHHSLYVPRDFDVSPYFQIIKPTLTLGFDFHRLVWAAEDASG